MAPWADTFEGQVIIDPFMAGPATPTDAGAREGARTGRGKRSAQAQPETSAEQAARQGAGTARNDRAQRGAQSEPLAPRVNSSA